MNTAFHLIGARKGGAKPPTSVPIAGRIRADGRKFANDKGRWRPLLASGFALSTKIMRDRAGAEQYLDWLVATGFNGYRLFLGHLGWADQTPEQALDGLPTLLQASLDRHLYVVTTCLTGTAEYDYDIHDHCESVGRIDEGFLNAIGEIANEPWHGTQNEETHDYGVLQGIGHRSFASRGIMWSCGATPDDEPNPETLPLDDDAIWCHLDRGRDLWNMVRRCRELENASAGYHKPVWNGEPIGWGEVEEPSRRCAKPEIAFCMGALSRGFELGLVSHADHGLLATMPGPVQQQCHDAVVHGFNLFGGADLNFKNAGWVDSPVHAANFEKVIRVYSFLDSPSHGWTVLVGEIGD